jgi:hypothetical protein
MRNFKPKICTVCKKEFIPTSSKQKICNSVECSKEYRRIRDKRSYKSKVKKSIKIVCNMCGKEFLTSLKRRVVCDDSECKKKLKYSITERYRIKEREKKEPINKVGKLIGRSALYVGNVIKTIDEVKGEFLERGFTIIQDYYVNNQTPITCVCPIGHEISMTRSNVLSGSKCFICYHESCKQSIEDIREEFLKKGFTLMQDYYVDSKTPIQCICPEGHDTHVIWYKFKKKPYCIVCNSDSRKLDLEYVKEYLGKYGYFMDQDYYTNSDEPIKMVCPEGHHISIRFNLFKSLDNRCGVCAHLNHRLSFDDVKAYLLLFGYHINQDYYDGVDTPMLCICPKGHSIKVRFSGFKSGKRCGLCNPHYSKMEKEVFSFVKDTGIDVLENSRSIISPKELDIYIPSKKVAIEFCGLYWHSEISGGKENSYHYDKMVECAKKGIRLLTIFEDEWINRGDVVRSRILNALGLSSRRIFARKCVVREISFLAAKDFLDRYHLQGGGNSSKRWGLFLNDELLQVITVGSLSRAHTGRDGKYIELKRFASLPGISVVGGASKLFSAAKKYAISNGYTHFKSYCDMRYANYSKPVYEELGFELITFTKYTPHYIKGSVRFRNQGLRKTPEERLTGKTEWELRREQGYDRIWDCGHRTYVMKLV